MNLIEWIQSLKWIFTFDMTFIDIVQIVILSFAMYYLIKTLYRTRAWILLKGLVVIGVIYLAIWAANMTMLQIIMQSLFGTLMIAIVIMLQPELQRIVEVIGKKNLTSIKALLKKRPEQDVWYGEEVIAGITNACDMMSAKKTGALIVIEREIPLRECINSGIKLSADVSSELLLNVFEKNTPLHDGAVIISNGKLESATSYLPLSSNKDIDKSYGTRHRAALGITESTDCMVIVVSEETGGISFCENGKIKSNLYRSELIDILRAKMNKTNGINLKKREHHSPLWMKIIAPIIAFILCLAITGINDPIISKTIDDVPVNMINTDVLDDAGQSYAIKSGQLVTVKVKGKRSIVEGLTKEDFIATADCQSMSLVYSVPITITTTNVIENIEIVNAYSSTLVLSIEDLTQTEVTIEVVISSDVDDRYVVKVNDMEMETLTITCPESIARTLDKAIVTIDAYGKKNDFVTISEAVVYDKNGNEIDVTKWSGSNKVRIDVSVFEVKELPLRVQLQEQDQTSDKYYILNDFVLEMNKVFIAGDNSVIDTMDEIVVTVSPNMEVETTKSMLINLQQYLPDNVYLAKNQQEQINVELDLITYKKHELELTEKDIVIIGLQDKNLEIELIQTPSRILLYFNANILTEDIVSTKTLSPTIKITESEPGEYDGTLLLTEIEGVNIVSNLSVKYSLIEQKGEVRDGE